MSILVGTLLSVWITYLIKNDFSISTILIAWSLHPATRLSPSNHDSDTTPPFTYMFCRGLKVETSVFYLFKDPSAYVLKLDKESSLSFQICTDAKSSSISSRSVLTKLVEHEANISLQSGLRANELNPPSISASFSFVWDNTVTTLFYELTSDTLRDGNGYSLHEIKYLLPFKASLLTYNRSVI